MNVEQLLKSKNIAYKEKGNDFIVTCFNPDHEDTHPSLRIDKTTGAYHCFSCGYSGNILLENNISLPKIAPKIIKLKKQIQELRNRGSILPPGAEPFFQEYRNISAHTFYKFNAFTKSNDPLYAGRICIPITSIDDTVEVIVARRLFSDLNPKYLVIPEGKPVPLFPSKVNSNRIILVEGIFDLLNLWDKGLKDVVCCFGLLVGNSKNKKTINKALEKFIPYKIQGVEKVYIMFDGDKAGREAATNLKKHLDFPYVETIDLPDDIDPGKLTLEQVKHLKGLLNEQ